MVFPSRAPLSLQGMPCSENEVSASGFLGRLLRQRIGVADVGLNHLRNLASASQKPAAFPRETLAEWNLRAFHQQMGQGWETPLSRTRPSPCRGERQVAPSGRNRGEEQQTVALETVSFLPGNGFGPGMLVPCYTCSVLLLIRAMAENPQGPVSAEQVLTALHGANRARLPATFFIGRIGNSVGLFCRLPTHLRATFERSLLDSFSDCQIEVIPEEALNPDPKNEACVADVAISPDLFSLRTHREFAHAASQESNPLSHLLSAVSTKGNLVAWIEITVIPARKRRIERARRDAVRLGSAFLLRHPQWRHTIARFVCHRNLFVRFVSRNILRLCVRKPDDERNVPEKLGMPLYEACIRITISSSKNRQHDTKDAFSHIVGALSVFAEPGGAGFKAETPRKEGTGRWCIWPHRRRGYLLSVSELATLWHPTTENVHAAHVTRMESRELPPPESLPSPEEPGTIMIGNTVFRGRRHAFSMRLADRRRHLYLIGKTGTGKTTLLKSLIIADILAGRGVVVIDPHGDLFQELLTWIPTPRTNDVVLVDPMDTAHPVAFNPLDSKGVLSHRTADGVLAAMKKLFGDSWGPRLEHTLGMSLATLCTVGGHSLLSVAPASHGRRV